MRAKVEVFVDLDAVAADADGALDRDAQAILYDRLDWYRLTSRHVLDGAAPLVVRAALDGAAAWLFLLPPSGGHAGPYGSWYTLRFAPVFAGEPDATVRQLLVRAIADTLKNGAFKKRVDRVSLFPLDEKTAALMQGALEGAGWRTERSFQTANWVARTADRDFDAYWAARPGHLRNTVKRKAAKAGLDIRLFDRFDEGCWQAYEQVFAGSWKGAEGSLPFLRALAIEAGEWGALRMAIGRGVDGVPLAAQFWTVDGAGADKIATIHKLAYVDAAKALSPGSVLSHAMFAHVIDRDRPAMIDFGTGDDPYKANWMDERRPLYRLEAYDPHSVRGAWAYARMRLGKLVRRMRTA